MKKSWLIVGLIIFVVVGAGLVWLIVSKASTPAPTGETSTVSSDSAPAVTDQTTAVQVAVTMKNTSFSPQTIKVKKGTKVTWTNEDSVRHNVVADSSNAVGLPTENGLLGKGQTYSFTFNTVGTIKYHCTPHPFMTGTIEVVE